MKTIFKILFSVILLTNSQELFAQQDDLANKFTTGKYISKTEADDYLGVWKSVDGNYTILLTKEIKKYKTDVVNFSID